MAEVDFFFDVVSPYSYLASTQLSSLALRTGATIVWRPFFLGGVMHATGNQPPATLAARAPYIAQDLQRWADHYGVAYVFPPRFPVNTLLAQRALVCLPAEAVPDTASQLFRAMWVDGRDLSDPAVVASLVGDEAVAAAREPAAKKVLRDNSNEAVAAGAFGAPTFVIEGALYFGNDRLPFLEAHLQRLGTS